MLTSYEIPFPMKKAVEHSLKQLSGLTVLFARIATASMLGDLRVEMFVPGFMNVAIVTDSSL